MTKVARTVASPPAPEQEPAEAQNTPAQEQPAEQSPDGQPAAAAQDQASPALAGKYAVVGVVPGRIYTPSHGIVDLRTISLEQANELVALGNFPYLVALG